MNLHEKAIKDVRKFVASIGYPVGSFSYGGTDEAALVRFILAQRAEAVSEYTAASIDVCLTCTREHDCRATCEPCNGYPRRPA